jgi:hypothetical protein
MPAALTLLEVAVQGGSGLPPTIRLPLRPGFNQITGDPEAQDTFLRTLWSLLFGDLGFGGSGARAAVSILAGDGLTYRLLAATGAPVNVSRLDAQAGKFEPLAAEGGAGRLLREWGLPERRIFEAFFLLSAPPAPSVVLAPQTLEAGPLPGAKLGLGIESKFAELSDQLSQIRVPQDPQAIQARLREIEKEDREASDLEQLQFQMDGLQQQLFQAEDALKTLDQLTTDLARIDKELSELPEITEELVAQVQRLPQLSQKRKEALERVAEEREDLQSTGAEVSLGGLARDRWFMGAILAGVACVVVAILASPIYPGLRWLALGNIPAFGLAASVAIQRLSAIRGSQGASRKLQTLQEREARIQRAFESESRDIVMVMKALGVEGAAELEERLAQRQGLMRRRVDCEEKLRRAEAEDAAEGRRVLRDSCRTQVAALEQQLGAFGYRRDRAEIRKEQEDLKAALSKLGGGMDGGLEMALEGDRPAGDSGAILLNQAGELFAMSPAMVLQTIRERLTQYLGAFSNRRFSSVSFAPDGQLLMLTPTAASTAFGQLAEFEQHAALMALRLCLAERYLASHRLFMLIDERSDGLDQQRRELCAKLLKGLSRFGQVLWLGQQGASVADHVVKLSA